MEKKDWNLVILVINGTTLCNLRGPDGKPAVRNFGNVDFLVRHVGQGNVVIVFTGVESDEQKETVNRWLLDHSFFDKGRSGMLYNDLLFLPDVDAGDIVLKAREHFYSDSYKRTLLISDEPAVITVPSHSPRYTTRVLLNMSDPDATQFEIDAMPDTHVLTLEELNKKADKLLAEC